MSGNALIVGAGSGISASFARCLHREGYKVALAARRPENVAGFAAEIGATTHACDATQPDQVANLFADLDKADGDLDVVLYNASARAHGPITELDPVDVANSLAISAYGGFLAGQQAAKRMVPRGKGTILFTGASASVKGYPHSSIFAMGKHGLRGLASAMGRELAPQGVHVCHFVIDGGVRNALKGRTEGPDDPSDKYLCPDAIAETYMHVVGQDRSSWSWEIELRPYGENY
ncbi:MAG: SDR family NAD(P)-dependent oxidoreductase [Chromatiales bacterium]|jgi:NAD(P)-dependent dehydrogenase (short-subunit alcohol dehydrogenase family)|nr:SDR family NAD(P)-dependent oxidoreductase [Chromatiales bacterium]